MTSTLVNSPALNPTTLLGANTCIVGATGTGKTTLLRQAAQAALLADHIVYAVGDGFTGLADHVRVATTPAEAVQELVDVIDHITKRREAMKVFGAATMADLPPEARALMPPVTVVIDDLSTLVTVERHPRSEARRTDTAVTIANANRTSVERIIQRIARHGTKYGVHLVVTSGAPIPGWGTPKMHRHFPVRGVLPHPDTPMPDQVVHGLFGETARDVLDVLADGATRGTAVIARDGNVTSARIVMPA